MTVVGRWLDVNDGGCAAYALRARTVYFSRARAHLVVPLPAAAAFVRVLARASVQRTPRFACHAATRFGSRRRARAYF